MHRFIIVIVSSFLIIGCNNNSNSEVRITTLDYSNINTFLKDSLPSVVKLDSVFQSEFIKWEYITELNAVESFHIIDPAQLSFPLNLLKTNIQKVDEKSIPELFNSPQIIGRLRVLKTDILKINEDDFSDETINIFKNHIKDIVLSYNAFINMMNYEAKKSDKIDLVID